jgi:hypothetical protein
VVMMVMVSRDYSSAVKMDTFFGCVGGKIRLLRCVLLVAFCAVRSVLLHSLGIRCVVAVGPVVEANSFCSLLASAWRREPSEGSKLI